MVVFFVKKENCKYILKNVRLIFFISIFFKNMVVKCDKNNLNLKMIVIILL